MTKTIGVVAVAALPLRRGNAAPYDHGDLLAQEIGRQSR
jgi:hypothetical protein